MADTVEMNDGSEERRRTPGQFLQHVIGKPVLVKLNSGIDYKGTLNCLDGYMNIAMENAKEYVNGHETGEYGDCFIRGNNGGNCREYAKKKSEIVLHENKMYLKLKEQSIKVSDKPHSNLIIKCRQAEIKSAVDAASLQFTIRSQEEVLSQQSDLLLVKIKPEYDRAHVECEK